MSVGLSNTQVLDADAAPSRSLAWFGAMQFPLAFAAANYFLWPLTMPDTSGPAATLGFNLVRLVLMAWAGHRVVRVGGVGLVGAALAGACVMLVDHLVLKGGACLILYEKTELPAATSHLLAFAGVLISFALFAPLAGVVGLCGGLLARRGALSRAA